MAEKNLKQGMVLHVKGAKDGRGMREFIDWDGDLLLCWQLNQDGNRTTCVTTHMPDKVIWVRVGSYRPHRHVRPVRETFYIMKNKIKHIKHGFKTGLSSYLHNA